MTDASRPWLGVNYWSRAGGPRMWTQYDESVVREELVTLHEHGLDTTRSFLFWPDFMPGERTLDEELYARFRAFMDLHTEIGMRTIPTFLVGHMSGANFSPSWRDGRSLYRDSWLLGRQAWYIRESTRRLHDHPAVAGWLLSNEMPIFGDPEGRGSAEDHEPVAAWAEIMTQAVRAGGGHQPVSTGDGAWGIEVTGRDNGFRIRELAPVGDFVGPHVYRMEDDQSREFLTAAFIGQMLSFTGKPVVLEEFGVTSAYVSAERAAHYYRQVLHTTLVTGTRGWLAWNNTDYGDLWDQDPYRHHPFEIYFGVTDSKGRPKSTLRELAAFSRVLDEVDVATLAQASSGAALVVPSFLEHHYEMTPAADGPVIFDALRQAWIAAWEADLPVTIEREADTVAEGHALYLVPSVKHLLTTTWRRLEELAAGGATVYVSYCAGEGGWQRGPWWLEMNEIFGVEHQLRYGLADPIEDESVIAHAVADFGTVTTGTELAFRAAGTVNSRSYLPVRATDAEVLWQDGHGRPMLLRRRVGSGQLVLGTYPLEHMASRVPGVNPTDGWRLYDALAAEAGLGGRARADDARVHVRVLGSSGGPLLWVMSQTEEALTVTVTLPTGYLLGAEVTGRDVTVPVERHGSPIDLEPCGVRVFRLQRPDED
ncbi:glycoside hydrolase 5 family protein [Occultella gossypii]|uniref:Beta-mannosidase n=1 Tax=Occultella gossypii TaxID=2800820 RepID=A0ABS7S6N3_9MICO|nr:beta-mannosidase [Occultella gossypii]MBZ2194966.1 beta-mannosidase [Occultella gossypii]